MKTASFTLCNRRCSAQYKSATLNRAGKRVDILRILLLSPIQCTLIIMASVIETSWSQCLLLAKEQTIRKLRWGWGIFECEFINFSFAWIYSPSFLFTSSPLSPITFLILATASKFRLALKSFIFKYSKCVLHSSRDIHDRIRRWGSLQQLEESYTWCIRQSQRK